MKNLFKTKIVITFSLLVLTGIVFSCEFNEDLPEANSIGFDENPPIANFSFTQNEDIDFFTEYSFANQSSNELFYLWDFGGGQTSTEPDPQFVFPGEGTFPVSLTVSDALDQSDTFTENIVVLEPEAPAVPDPVLINADFDRLAKLGSSNTCSCSGWDNDDIGEQGESSSGNGGNDNVVKFDNNEPDHVYQEFEVVPNSDYVVQLVTSFKSIANPPGSFPGSFLEVRVLAGSGYESGYTPTYYATAPEFPNSGYGYTSVAQVEDAANNLLTETITNPGNDDYNASPNYIFNSGANDSVALFIRGLGGATGGNYNYNSGDEEIRADFVTITAVN